MELINILGGLGGAIANIFTSKNQTAISQSQLEAERLKAEADAKKQQTIIAVVVVVAIAAIIIAVISKLRSKRNG